jgi:hypothetical protein
MIGEYRRMSGNADDHLFRAAFQINYSSNMLRNNFRILRGHDDFGQLGYSGEENAEQAASSNL